MYIRILFLVLVFLFTSACTSNGTLNTENLEVERKDIHTTYVPVEKGVAEKALPFEMEYPTYFPFEKEELKVSITGWENGKEKVVASFRYPSIEADARWKKGSFTQPAIPFVNYTVANFDRYYSKYGKMDGYEELEIEDGGKGLFKVNKEMEGAHLHWIQGEREYNLELMYFSEGREELKTELLRIANSISIKDDGGE